MNDDPPQSIDAILELIDTLGVESCASHGLSSARFWRVKHFSFHIGALAGEPISLPPGYAEDFKGIGVIPPGVSILAVTSRKREWKIYASGKSEKRWLQSLGLDQAVFPTRREALEQLKLGLRSTYERTAALRRCAGEVCAPRRATG
jgi:hypothetical protein